MSRGTWAEIDASALRHNVKTIQHIAPHQLIIAMIKANAYGHGINPIAAILSETDIEGLGVAVLEEALVLRQAGISKRIILMEGVFNAAELIHAASENMDVVVHHLGQLELLEQVILPHPIRVWLKIDTGMHRLGFSPEDVKIVWQRLHALSQVESIILMSHFACADQHHDPKTEDQFKVFEQITAGIPGLKSLANSAIILHHSEKHADLLRPGIMLYGISPFSDELGEDYNLKPVMTLHARIIAVKTLKAGESVGYGAIWNCPSDRNIGVVSVGYGDGYPRHAINGTPVLVNGRRASLIGRVSMDMITVDLYDQPDAKVGDPVILWGRGLPIETIAQCANTIAYQLTTQVTARVPRVIV